MLSNLNISKKITLLTYLIFLTKSVFITIKTKGEEYCFIIRSENSREYVNFSYVVHSSMHIGNKIEFKLIERDTNDLIQSVEPDKNSYQRIFKFKSDKKTIYKACFINPDEYEKKIKFYVDNINKTEYIDKNKLKASYRMLNKLTEESTKLDDQVFIDYLLMKDIDENMANSNWKLSLSFLFKFVLIVSMASLQVYSVVDYYKKNQVKLGNIV